MLDLNEYLGGLLSGLLFAGLAVQIAAAKGRPMVERTLATLPPLTMVGWVAVTWFDIPKNVPRIAETINLVSWVAVLGIFHSSLAQNTGWRRLALKLVPTTMIALFAGVLSVGDNPSLLYMISMVALLVIGLVELEQIIRLATREETWAVKHALIALGAILALNLYLYADGMLLLRLNPLLLQVRFVAYALCAPLLMISTARLRGFRRQIRLSRKGAFNSIAVLLVGLYFLAMALAGYVMRQFGIEWGGLPQLASGFAAVIVLPLLLTSGSARAKLKIFISKNFFSYRYDYREEWLRFIKTVAHDVTEANLHLRVIKGIADIVEASSGALWQRSEEDSAVLLSEAWNMGAQRLPAIPLGSSLVSYMERTGAIIDLFEYRSEPQRYPGLELPEWLRDHPRGWLLVPMRSRERMTGFVLLGEPRVRRRLIWEDFDILKTVGHHAAGYMTEEKVLNDLSDARRLEAFNRRFAFIIHDIKNVVSQMALMLRNAERYADNPEFQKDMLETVANSVTNLTALLQQIKATSQPTGDAAERAEQLLDAPEAPTVQRLAALVDPVAERWRKQHAGLGVEITAAQRLHVSLRPTELGTVLDHLLQNAAEATGAKGRIMLTVSQEDGSAVVAVSDDGPGMTENYMREELFRPLASQKHDGFGLGAFQCREMVRAMGGRLEVASTPGEGTTMTIYIPLQSAAASVGNM